MTWKATWPGSAMDAYGLLEEMIYGETHDEAIRQAHKKGVCPPELTTQDAFNGAFDEIKIGDGRGAPQDGPGCGVGLRGQPAAMQLASALWRQQRRARQAVG
eukprot:11212154-Lingulodinium_polyedra.AAC.1